MKFVGVVAFLDSAEKADDNRVTNVMDFELAADWFTSVTEFYRCQAMVGEYDGSEILIQIHRYEGPIGKFGKVEGFPFDSDTLIDDLSIMNPYYV